METQTSDIALLRRELEDYIKLYSLSEREADILYFLVDGDLSSEAIAQKTGTSPNTINNQLKTLFEKTKTHSRSELLSHFILFSFKRLKNLHLFARAPRIFVIDDEPDIVEILKESLVDRGFHVEASTDPVEALNQIAAFNPDLVISDVIMPKRNGYDILAKLREFYDHHPHVLFITGHSPKPPEELYDMGAVGCLTKPIDFDKLFFTIMEFCVSSEYERNRLLRVKTDSVAIFEEKQRLRMSDIGFGGAFIQLDFSRPEISSFFKAQKTFDFKFHLQDSSAEYSAKAEVMWVRTAKNRLGNPGAGVRFLELSPEGKKAVEDYVRCNRIRSFIPLGVVPVNPPA